MNYAEAINIPVTLSGDSIASSLLPALCWRHHILYVRNMDTVGVVSFLDGLPETAHCPKTVR